MYMNRFLTGAVIGGAVGVMATAYTLASNHEKKQFAKMGKKFTHML